MVAQPPARASRGLGMKGSQKPKKLQKKQATKTLKERRVEKRAAARRGPALGA